MGKRFRRPSRLAALVGALAASLTLGPLIPAALAAVVDLPTEQVVAAADGPVLGGHRETLLDDHPWLVEPQTTLVWRADRNRKVRVDSAKGSRVWTVSALASHDLPQAAMRAYQDAAATMARTDPSCQLPWTLLAGIGRVESDHGRYGGSVLSTDGISRPAIIGVALNGAGPVAAIRDTDGGRWDGDKVWDRAVGPMQFIPSTWTGAGRDGDGDGKADPNDLDDAALAAAGYLCSGSGSLLDPAAMAAAILRYNPSDYYVALVMAFERGYRTGVFIIPSPTPPAAEQGPAARHRHQHRADGARSAHGGRHGTSDGPGPSASAGGSGGSGSGGSGGGSAAGPKPAPQPAPKPSPKPSPSPTPTPTPTPTPSPSPSVPQMVTLAGTLTQPASGGWFVGGTPLDLGPAGQLSAGAAYDFDGDGAVEANSEELAGLAGKDVTLQVGAGTSPAVVYLINDKGYRNADGGFVRPAAASPSAAGTTTTG
ncbi:lytic murein transglycosylase [Nocardioides mesophilus]|uniref:lytic murein transglycosylase n=1 Tax=Nocardioides mesophilus TaxID=433659 RepID=UPI001CB746CA|nr:lytic murein transglycosylase [Nocardioides mesophilus]